MALSSQPGLGSSSTRELVNIGHRGASAYAPENTIAAYDLALSQGVHYIELDVHMTLDGELVVLHDESVERTGLVPPGYSGGLIRSKTLEELRALDVGSWFNEANEPRRRDQFIGLKMPTLEEVLARYRHCVKFCIELKAEDLTGGIETKLLRLLSLYGLDEPKNGRWRVLMMSFGELSLQRIKSLHPQLPLLRLFEPGAETGPIIEALSAVRHYASAVSPPKGAVDAALVAAAHESGLQVHPYTVNSTSEMTGLLELGVDGMITDFPDRLDALLWHWASGSRPGSLAI